MGKSALLLSALVALSSFLPTASAGTSKGFIKHKYGGTKSDHSSIARRQSEDTDVCRWWGHASVLIGEKLYISGGMYTLHDVTNKYDEGWMTVPFLFRSIDLSKKINLPLMLTDRAVQQGARVNDEDTAEATSGGTLLTDGDSFLYKFGGYFPDPELWSDTPQATVREAELWRYDLNQPKWLSDKPDAGRFGEIVRPYFSAYASVPELKKAYVVGGMVSNDSDTAFLGLPTPGFMVLGNSFLELGLARGEFYNSTVVSGLGPIAGASMVTIPEVGKQGIIVLMGGITQSTPETWITPSNQNITSTLALDHVWVFDIESEKWYKQKTYGKAPPGRMTFCATTVKAQDESSYNIIINGGVSAVAGSRLAYADTWLLSLPSFTWVQLDSRGEGRFEHTCHTVKGNQLLVVGGRDMAQFNGRDPWDGNRTFKFQDWTCLETGLLSVLDLNALEWTKSLPEEETAFKIPEVLTKEIGGDEEGNAELRQPEGGYDDPALDTLFETKTTLTPVIPGGGDGGEDTDVVDKPPPSKDGPPVAVIAGATVGGVVVLAIIGAIIYCVRRRRNPPPGPEAAAAAVPLDPDQHNQPAMATVGSPAPTHDAYFQQQQQQYYPPQYPQHGVYPAQGYEGAYAPPQGAKYDPQAGGYYSPPIGADPRYSYAGQGGIAPVEIGGEGTQVHQQQQQQGGHGYEAYSPPPVAKDGTVSGAYEMPGTAPVDRPAQ